MDPVVGPLEYARSKSEWLDGLLDEERRALEGAWGGATAARLMRFDWTAGDAARPSPPRPRGSTSVSPKKRRRAQPHAL